MKNIIKNSGGFGAIEIILIVVVLGLIGYTGYNAYSQQHKNTSDNVQTTSTPTTTSTKSPTTTDPEVSYLTVKEWGIKVPQLPKGNVVTYQISANDKNDADFVTSGQKALGGTCGTFGSARYHVYQADSGYKSSDETFQTKLNYAAANNLTVVANGKTYYIIGDMSGGDCTGTLKAGQSTSQQEATANSDLLTSLKGLLAN